jgi:acyl carrier protein
MQNRHKLLQTYRSVFPNLAENDFGDSLRLCDIADWDSMNTVTLILFLEEAYGVSLTDIEFTRDTSVADAVSVLKSKGADIE